MKRMIFSVLASLVFSFLAGPVLAELGREKVDSMFLIASSGAMKYRDLVEPTKTDIAALGIEVVPFLIDKLGATDARERSTLEDIFKKIGPPAVPYLNDALIAVTDSLQLSRVALILYYLPDTSSIESLMKVKDHSFYWVRYETIRALGNIGYRRGLEAVKSALKDDNELVRTMAAVAAGRIVHDKELFDILVPALDDKYYGVRFAAFEALMGLDCSTKRGAIFAYIDGDGSYFQKSYLAMIMAQDSCQYDVEKIKSHCQGTWINSFMFQAYWKIDCAAAYNTMQSSLMTDSNTDSIRRRWSNLKHLIPSLPACDEKEKAPADSR